MPLRIKKGGDNSEDRQNRRVEHMIGKSRSSKREKGIKKSKMLTGGQAKIAAKAPPTNKIDAKDFAVLRAEKAKGRGMGLQDEQVKPGKVMKAKRGKFLRPDPTKPISSVKPKTGKTDTIKFLAKKKGLPMPLKSFLERRKELGGRAMRAAKATRIGKMMLPIAAAGVAAQQYLKSKMKKKDEPKKKMGGGMMKRPMGYTKGGELESRVSSKEVYKDAIANAKGRKFLKMKDIKEARREAFAAKKMGGGMMKKPMGYKKGKEIDYGKVFDKKFYSSALEKEAQLHADDYDAGLDRAERRAASETTALMKKNKKMGGGMMMKPMGYKSGTSVKVKCKLGRNKPTKMY